jgi:hypothetical protein
MREINTIKLLRVDELLEVRLELELLVAMPFVAP